MTARAVLRVAFNSNDAERLCAFYRDAFGFTTVSESMPADDLPSVLGADDMRATVTTLRLGDQMIDITAFSPPGRAYPPDITADDVRFQHIAIVVSDMSAAYQRLQTFAGWQPISRGGPQRLPDRSGAVTAFKFRDPDGHPLELLAFPPGAVPARWTLHGRTGHCLGIDHSAITVSETGRSLALYKSLFGLSVVGGSLNRGPEQERLDSVPEAVVDVTALRAPAGDPGIELLCYTRTRGAAPLRATDVAATRLVLEMDDLPAIKGAMAGNVLSPGLNDSGDGPAFAARDPDGHHLVFMTSR